MLKIYFQGMYFSLYHINPMISEDLSFRDIYMCYGKIDTEKHLTHQQIPLEYLKENYTGIPLG